MDQRVFTIEEEQAGQRLDKALTALCDELSRARVQALIKEGSCAVNGMEVVSASLKVSNGDKVSVLVPEIRESELEPEDIPLDIVYEDEDVLVLNKPAGLVVHPGAGNVSGTLVNALLFHFGDNLSAIGGVARPGIVHRLDKDTSGLMMVAKNDAAHQGLSEQLADRTLSRVYQALVLDVPMPPVGFVDAPIGRHRTNRLKMAVYARAGKEARTNYKVLEDYHGALALVECKLESGRTHQIRVHMEYFKHPLIGDPLYSPQPTAVRARMKKAGYEAEVIEQALSFPRQALHAKSLTFVHPRTWETMRFDSDLPGDLSNLLKMLQ